LEKSEVFFWQANKDIRTNAENTAGRIDMVDKEFGPKLLLFTYSSNSSFSRIVPSPF